MMEIPAVTADDVAESWNVFYTSEHYGPIPPRAGDWLDDSTLAQLRRVLVADRKRVAERLKNVTHHTNPDVESSRR
jgi:hypothetical protein